MEHSGNILFCGVGGQGILLASEVTAYAVLAYGLDVKKSEVHGMAQRGGTVEAHLRYGTKVYSPLIEPGTVDILVAFEVLEAVRYLSYLHMHTKVIVNMQKIMPSAVTMGKMEYPDNVLHELTGKGIDVVAVDGFSIAEDIGETRTTNVVLVGAMSTFLPIPEETFIDVIKTRVPERFQAVNIQAFQEGRKSNHDRLHRNQAIAQRGLVL